MFVKESLQKAQMLKWGPRMNRHALQKKKYILELTLLKKCHEKEQIRKNYCGKEASETHY